MEENEKSTIGMQPSGAGEMSRRNHQEDYITLDHVMEAVKAVYDANIRAENGGKFYYDVELKFNIYDHRPYVVINTWVAKYRNGEGISRGEGNEKLYGFIGGYDAEYPETLDKIIERVRDDRYVVGSGALKYYKDRGDWDFYALEVDDL